MAAQNIATLDVRSPLLLVTPHWVVGVDIQTVEEWGLGMVLLVLGPVLNCFLFSYFFYSFPLSSSNFSSSKPS
jgi:hypothetical protein